MKYFLPWDNLPNSMVAAKNSMREIAIPLEIWRNFISILEEEDQMSMLELTIVLKSGHSLKTAWKKRKKSFYGK